jgi:hypothetical protein
MILPKTETEYMNALVDFAEIGAKKALIDAGVIRPYLKLREAYRLYGEAQVKRWLKEGLINSVKDGNNNATVRINRIEIEAASKASNRATYLTTQERNSL